MKSVRVATTLTAVVRELGSTSDEIHGCRQDDFQGGAHDNSGGVHKDFPEGVHMPNIFCTYINIFQLHVLCIKVE